MRGHMNVKKYIKFNFCVSMHHYIRVNEDQPDANCLVLLYYNACALYDAPEDGSIWHPKHVERGKCNKVTLNNLHQAGLHLPVY